MFGTIDTMSKKIIFAIIGLVLALGVGLAIFFFRGGEEEISAPEIPTFPESAERPGIAGGGKGGEFPEGEAGLPGETAAGLAFQEVPNLSAVGFVPLGTLAQLNLRIRFMEVGTGHVYEYYPATGELIRLTNTTIPRVRRVWWGATGENLVLFYLDEAGEAKYFLAKVNTATTTGVLEGNFLPSATYDLAFSPDGKELVVLQGVGDGTAVGLFGLDGKIKKTLLSLPLKELSVSWPNKNTLLVATRPSAQAQGFLWSVGISRLPKAADENILQNLLGPIKGLTSVATSNFILWSQTAAAGLETFLLDKKTGQSRPFIIKTLPEKCAFSQQIKEIIFCAEPQTLPRADYPDDWYQGALTFSDTIWQVNLALDDAYALFIPGADALLDIDATDLALSADEEYLFFKNKSDDSLWSLKLRAAEF